MSLLNGTKEYKVSDLIVSKKDSAGISMLVSLDESENFYRIDGIASQAWEMIVEGLSLAQISQNLISQYPDHKEEVLKDLEAFIHKLIELKILE
jgi:hypothetical protein